MTGDEHNVSMISDIEFAAYLYRKLVALEDEREAVYALIRRNRLLECRIRSLRGIIESLDQHENNH